MKHFLAIACVVGVLGGHSDAAGADEPADSNHSTADKSPLAADGELQKLREPLSQIFQLKLESGNLKFDRSAWETAAAEIERKSVAAAKDAENLPPGMDPESPQGLRYRARLLQDKALQLERQQSNRFTPVISRLVPKRRRTVATRTASTGGATGYSSNGKQKTYRRTFEGKTLTGERRTDNDGDSFTVRELESPNRTLELSSNSDTGFRIELSDPAGNLILLRQRPDCFSAVSVVAGKVQIAEGKSFVDACRRNRAQMEADLLPVLVRFGFCPVVSPGEPEALPRASQPNVSWGESTLLGKGNLQEYRESLANVFKFSLIDGQLKIDREAWKSIAEEIKKEFADAAENAKAQAELRGKTRRPRCKCSKR